MFKPRYNCYQKKKKTVIMAGNKICALHMLLLYRFMASMYFFMHLATSCKQDQRILLK